MDKFIASLHKKPDHHKKRFAFMTSATITLFIFGIWSVVNFGISDESVIARVSESNLAAVSESVDTDQVSPFSSIRMSFAESLEGLSAVFQDFKSSVESINLEAEYTELRNQTLETYGQ